MLLWEALTMPTDAPGTAHAHDHGVTVRSLRLPYDRRCAALTKAGSRCRGRIRPGKEFCLFHDPEITAERRRGMATKAACSRRRLKHLPDGYLRKLTSTAAVGEAMDRLYREIRLGDMTPEMGKVLFDILSRLLDSGLIEAGKCPQRTKAARVRPRLSELLTHGDRKAWRQAVANADGASAGTGREGTPASTTDRTVPLRPEPSQTDAKPLKLKLQAAS